MKPFTKVDIFAALVFVLLVAAMMLTYAGVNQVVRGDWHCGFRHCVQVIQ